MSRWNTSDEWGEPKMIGDKVVRNPHKAKHKDVIRGCPGNDHKEHFYVATKEIRIWTLDYQNRPKRRDTMSYSVACLFCGKHSSSHIKRIGGKRLPKAGVEVDKTIVYVYGRYVRTENWKTSGYMLASTKTFNGDTDEKGLDTSKQTC